MIATAIAMAADLDVRFQTAIAQHLPAALVNPTQSLEDSARRQARSSTTLRGPLEVRRRSASGRADAPRARKSELPDLGAAPDFAGTQRWFNTPGGEPLTLAGLRGRVVLIDFWTYTCINCIRTLPVRDGLGRTLPQATG